MIRSLDRSVKGFPAHGPLGKLWRFFWTSFEAAAGWESGFRSCPRYSQQSQQNLIGILPTVLKSRLHVLFFDPKTAFGHPCSRQLFAQRATLIFFVLVLTQSGLGFPNLTSSVPQQPNLGTWGTPLLMVSSAECPAPPSGHPYENSVPTSDCFHPPTLSPRKYAC